MVAVRSCGSWFVDIGVCEGLGVWLPFLPLAELHPFTSPYCSYSIKSREPACRCSDVLPILEESSCLSQLGNDRVYIKLT